MSSITKTGLFNIGILNVFALTFKCRVILEDPSTFLHRIDNSKFSAVMSISMLSFKLLVS